MSQIFVMLLSVMLLAISNAHAADVPFWGDKTSMPVGTLPQALKPGQFVWDPAAAPAGPVVMVVSLPEQRGYVYRNGIDIGVTTVSTGRPGHQSPTGVFTILQKDKDHHSSIYNDAAMPYTERLTWGGVALHAGGLPGYPSSHGCVHLPSAFAQALFGITPMGMTVVIADETSEPSTVVHPAVLAPVDVKSGAAEQSARLTPDESYRWEPQKSPSGPLSILISSADQRVLVYRNGVEIGRARLTIDEPGKALGTHVFVASEKKDASAAPGKFEWMAVGIPGHYGEARHPLDPDEIRRVHFPAEFQRAVAALIQPGVTLFVTDSPVLESTTGVNLQVVNGDPQNTPQAQQIK